MVTRKEIDFGHSSLILETGKLAQASNGAVWIQFGESVILATVVADDEPMEDLGFLPLTVDYREKAYAAGKIPGGFFKREGRPSESEILSARLIDRPIRPLFPDNFNYRTQIICWVLSADRENDADVLGVIGASAALSISDIPFEGPVGAVRIGKIGGNLVVNPTFEQLEDSEINLIIAGSETSVVMVEGESFEILEDEMVEAIEFGHEHIKKIITLQNELVAECGKPKRDMPEPEDNSDLISKIEKILENKLEEALQETDKKPRKLALKAIENEVQEALAEEYPEQESLISSIVKEREKNLIRGMILQQNRRPDGRTPDDIRNISVEVGMLPRAH